MSEMKVVGTYSSRYEAEMARELLLEQGIKSMIAADDCGGQLMGLSSIRKTGIRILVRDEDLVRAEEVLQVLKLD